MNEKQKEAYDIPTTMPESSMTMVALVHLKNLNWHILDRDSDLRYIEMEASGYYLPQTRAVTGINLTQIKVDGLPSEYFHEALEAFALMDKRKVMRDIEEFIVSAWNENKQQGK